MFLDLFKTREQQLALVFVAALIILPLFSLRFCSISESIIWPGSLLIMAAGLLYGIQAKKREGTSRYGFFVATAGATLALGWHTTFKVLESIGFALFFMMVVSFVLAAVQPQKRKIHMITALTCLFLSFCLVNISKNGGTERIFTCEANWYKEPASIAPQPKPSTTAAGSAPVATTPNSLDQDPDLIPAKLVRLIDGEHIEVKLKEQHQVIRLLMVDTPDTISTTDNDSSIPYAPEAVANLERTLHLNDQLFLEYDDTLTSDEDGHPYAYVYASGHPLNEELVEKGFARVDWKTYGKAKYATRYGKLENRAKELKWGIWSVSTYADANGYHPEKVKLVAGKWTAAAVGTTKTATPTSTTAKPATTAGTAPAQAKTTSTKPVSGTASTNTTTKSTTTTSTGSKTLPAKSTGTAPKSTSTTSSKTTTNSSSSPSSKTVTSPASTSKSSSGTTTTSSGSSSSSGRSSGSSYSGSSSGSSSSSGGSSSGSRSSSGGSSSSSGGRR
ncbi:thermonuclease family protein [Brevibacillus dissolubilis]|uniref:thermonuclease family protein n=1 Tax=Brevibacillus dissolubilis TaxID=1844116 RepID=UPI00111682D4|nr:thermonuclease family protein [Brevibacillus dissolubilis]